MKYFCIFLGFLCGLSPVLGQEKIYVNHTEIGTLSYGFYPGQASFSASTFHGVEFHRNYAVGLTLGVDRLRVEDEFTFWSFPIAVRGRYTLNPERKTAFYGSVDIGYGLQILNKDNRTENSLDTYDGGTMLNPQVGIRINSEGKKRFFSFSVGYKYTAFGVKRYYNFGGSTERPSLTQDLRGYQVNREQNYNLHRLSLMVGIGF
ncbi:MULTISPECIES: hypothetical protein [Sphingobacterium]|uniref:hypothetical protein n=1 Tax=Sphingobacterium TaxID=28453 RepID=UPI0013DCE5B0|nr:MULTISPECIES: hypothetical protein [unclassified Sphingobacterium]